MTKRALVAFAALAALTTTSLAAPQQKKTIKCPVMKSSVVNIAKATKKKLFADYKGRRYFFCCDGCPSAFKANPKKFASGESIRLPKIR
ncbi:MAG: YHS domain-containing protein [Fimbriimonadaceae bacterium]